MTAEQTYANALKTYYEALWATTARGDSGTETIDIFNTLNTTFGGRTEAYPDPLPADIAGNLITTTGKTPLQVANELVALRQAVRTAETALDNPDVAGAIANNLKDRLLNTGSGNAFVGGDGNIGHLNADDITAALAQGQAAAATAPTLTPEEAKPILERWIGAFLPGDADLPALRTALGIGADVDPSTVEILQGTAPDQTINPAVLRAYQSANRLTQSGQLDEATIAALRGDRFGRFGEGRRFTQGIIDWIKDGGTRPTGDAVEAAPATGQEGDGNNPLGGIWEGIQNFFGGTSAGGWIGGVLGVGLAWFASNMFGAGPFRSIMMLMLMPLLFMLGRNMGNEWGGESAEAPAAGAAPERTPTAPERVRTPATGASVNRVITPQEAQAMTADLQGMLSEVRVTPAPAAEQTDPTVLANIVPQDVTIRPVPAR